MSLTVGVDVGGTKIAAGVVDDTGAILASTRRPSPKDSAAELRALVAELVAELSSGREVTAVGVGAAGAVRADRRHVAFAPHLDWGTEPFADLLSADVGLPVVIENDANAAAWAEYRYGAGRGVADQLMVAVGTGVGGGIVIDGEIYRGGHGMAAEVGHIIYVPDGLPCPCGRRGCFEQYASGNALTRQAQEAARAGRAPHLLAAAGGAADAVSGVMVTDLAEQGDDEAVELLATLGRHLGTGIASLVAVLDPTLVVIGGGVSEAGELLRQPAEEALRAEITGGDRRPAPAVVMAALGNDAALIGAADLARHGGRPRPQ